MNVRSLRARLMLAFALMVALTVLSVGIPTVILMDREVTRQVEAQLVQGENATRALLNAEVRELRDLITLTSERPTLHRLLAEDNRTDLAPYLTDIQESAGLDGMTVMDAAGQLIAQLPPMVAFPVPLATVNAPAAAFEYSEALAGVVLVAHAPIIDAEGVTIGYLHEARLVNRAFLQNLYQETGLYHTLVQGDTLIASDLFTTPRLPTDLPYYTRRLPLVESPAGTIENMLALPTAEVNAARMELLQVMGLITTIVAVVAAGLAYLLARRVTSSLKKLVKASQTLGRLDLDTPIQVHSDVSEVETLSGTLEQMRKEVQRSYKEVDERRQRYENLVDSLTEGVITLNQEGHVTSFSAGATRILGWQAGDVIGKHHSVVFPSPTPQTPSEVTFYATPGTVTRRPTRTQQGEAITMRVTSGELTHSTETTWEQAYIFHNVTEEEQATRLREYLLASVSHEFKTPLSALHAAVELLATELPSLSPAEIQQLVESARQGTLRLDELVDNLISSAALQTGHFPVSLRPTDLDTIIEEVLLTTGPLLAMRGQCLKIDTPSPLRPVYADARRLHQVFINLISNAGKYGATDAPITLSVEERENESIVRVSDKGKGVPADLRPYLFLPFARQSTPDRTGIGLGLSIVKAIIERHGGRVGVDDAPNGGATFWFTLPVR